MLLHSNGVERTHCASTAHWHHPQHPPGCFLMTGYDFAITIVNNLLATFSEDNP
ncbi:MAG: hypothetical protein JWQ86_1795 [Mycobacterium sp.]|jgi:hypothetical protein|nr:hypothetical protein [Mycobacterium sp.]